MSEQNKDLIKYGDTFLEHYNAELGKLYNKFNEDLYNFTMNVNPEDLLGVRSVNVSKQGLFVISCTDSSVVKSFDFKNGTIPFIYEGHSRTVRMLSFDQNEKLLITGSWDGTIHVIDLLQRKRLKRFSGMGRVPCAYMHDNYICAGSYDGDIDQNLNNRGRLIDYNSGKILHFFNHGPSIQLECIDLVFLAPETIISGSDDGRIFKWKIDSNNEMPEFVGEFKPMKGCVRKMTLSPDLKLLATGSGDKSIRVYDVESLNIIREFKNSHKDTVTDVKFSSDQRFLYSCSFDCKIKKWELATGKEIFRLSEPKDWIWKLFLFQEKDILIAGSADGKAYFYDDTGKLLCTYYNLKDVSSFLFTSPPDPIHPKGSFFTNNPDMIHVTKKNGDVPIMVSVDEKKNYFQRHNNLLILQKINNPKSFEEKVISYDKKKKNSLRFIFPTLKQLGSGFDTPF